MADNARDAREPSAEESEWAGFSESADDDDMDFEVGVCLGADGSGIRAVGWRKGEMEVGKDRMLTWFDLL